MKLVTRLICFLEFLILISEAKLEVIIRAKGIGRHKELGVNYGNFKAHPNSHLNVEKIDVVLVHKVRDCGIACVEHLSCFSFNISIRPDRFGHFTCELLAANKYDASTKFMASGDFHHYSISTLCLKEPCKNGGSCLPNYENDTYKCVCGGRWKGTHCGEQDPKLGCFKDNPDIRAIPTLEGQDAILDSFYIYRKNAIAKCEHAAKKRGYQMFALQNGGWCASSATAHVTYNVYGKSNDCKGDGRGGPSANEVYAITDNQFKYTKVGCFKDQVNNRAIPPLEGQEAILDGGYYGARKHDITKCAHVAKMRGYKAFALQDGGWCASSANAHVTYNKYGKSVACKGDGKGGPSANEVYAIAGI